MISHQLACCSGSEVLMWGTALQDVVIKDGCGEDRFPGDNGLVGCVGKAGSCHVSRVMGRTRRTLYPHC